MSDGVIQPPFMGCLSPPVPFAGKVCHGVLRPSGRGLNTTGRICVPKSCLNGVYCSSLLLLFGSLARACVDRLSLKRMADYFWTEVNIPLEGSLCWALQ